jgi:two-component system phosphate regulon sensor histidine kinase PhoR
LLLACLAVGLLVVAVAAGAQLRDLEDSLRESERRAAMAELGSQAREKAGWLDERLSRGEPNAVYARDGSLLRPAPAAVAHEFEPPTESVALIHIRRNDLDEAWRAARTSAERVRVLLARGTDKDLEQALSEPALRGTELAYMVRLQRFRAGNATPDFDWIDDVSALLGGPSDRFARTLLKSAGVEAVGSPAERHLLAELKPRPGVFVAQGFVNKATPDGDRLLLRRWPSRAFGAGELAVALPAPYSMLRVLGAIDEAAVQAKARSQRPRVILMYAGAALLLVVGTAYAYVAIGRAVRLGAAKSDFVANVTHELKTPIANIRLYAESLRAGRVREEDHAEFLDTILEEGNRLESLVEGLLHAARGPRLEMRELDPASLLLEAETRWRPRLEKEGFSFSTVMPELPAVRGDREALLRAIDNLLDNARKYDRENRRVEMTGSAANGRVRLVVRDHGSGIPVADRERVLRPFTRLESADRKETPGTGLGLSLVVSTMEAHGGKVVLGKAVGGGTEVALVLPALEERSS